MTQTLNIKPIPAAPESSGAGGSAVLGLLTTFILLCVGWANTFVNMWGRWFPHWEYAGSLHDRLTKGDSYYTHGPMVPLVSLVIAFLIYRRVRAPIQRTKQATIEGWLLLGVSLFFHLTSVYARVTFVSGFALIGVLLGLLLIWGGHSLLRAYWLPVVFLAFMVPLPMETIDDLNFKLKTIASTIALGLTNNVFGVPAIRDGSYIHLLPGPDGIEKTLVVEDVCSGLRSMISLICFAALFALICRVKGFWRVVILAMAVPVAIAGNVVRLTALNLRAHYSGVEAAAPDTWFHDLMGLMVFVIALALLFGLEQLILLIGRLFKRNWSDPRLLGFLDSLPKSTTMRAATARPSILLILTVVAGLSVYYAIQTFEQNRGNEARAAVPGVIQIGDTQLGSDDLVLDEKTLTILETHDYVYRRYIDAPNRRFVDLLIVFSPDNRKGTHPPEICLKGGGELVVSKGYHAVALPRLGTVTMCELVTQRSTQQLTYHLYLYKCGDSYTANFFMQQLRIFLNGVTGRNAGGALIRIDAPVAGQDTDSARELALNAAKALLPTIDDRLK